MWCTGAWQLGWTYAPASDKLPKVLLTNYQPGADRESTTNLHHILIPWDLSERLLQSLQMALTSRPTQWMVLASPELVVVETVAAAMMVVVRVVGWERVSQIQALTHSTRTPRMSDVCNDCSFVGLSLTR